MLGGRVLWFYRRPTVQEGLAEQYLRVEKDDTRRP